jgi:hypothetical protein
MVLEDMSNSVAKPSGRVLLVQMLVGAVAEYVAPPLSAEARGDIDAAIKNGVVSDRDLKRFQHALEKHGLSGAAVVIRTDGLSKSAVPSPLAVHFEPLELDERNPALEVLCNEAPTTIARSRRMPPAAVGRRLLMRIGIPIAVTVLVSPCLTCDVLPPGVGLRGYVLTIPFATLIGIAAFFLLRGREPKWFLIPGGVVIREFVWGSLKRRLRTCTPSNSTVLIRQGLLGWQVRIFRGQREYQRELTDLETATLLAAWQSPISVPDLDQLRALL